MRIRHEILASVLFILTINPGCDRSTLDIPDEIQVIVNEIIAKTTDTVDFKIETVPVFDKRSTFFYRWDWNGDSIWDTKFSSLMTNRHRFLEKGKYSVHVICSNGKGTSISATQELQINQGYSKPIPNLSVHPKSANYTQAFHFDASNTFDFEDSLSDLEFRWDLAGDGHFEYQYDTIKSIYHTYSKPGLYSPSVEVRDPSGLIATKSIVLNIHNTDTLIDVKVSGIPDEISVGEVVTFDVSSSCYLSDPERDYQVSWFLPFALVYTKPEYSKTLKYTFQTEGENLFKCKLILDKTGLENEMEFMIFAKEENLPPTADFQLSIDHGNVNTQFYFNCWSCSDDHTPPSKLQLRFDWNNDDSWNTPFTELKEYYHQYSEAGEYGIVVEVKDEQGAISKAFANIEVSPFENPTGMIKDVRDDELYGTVLIGNQWWMAENLRYQVASKTEEGMRTTLCLFEAESWCEQVGMLYHVSSITNDRYDDMCIDVCPNGWRLPEKSDWEELFEFIGGSSGTKELFPGGNTDFYGRLLGLGEYRFVGSPIITDTIYTFKETFEKMYYPSSTVPDNINNARTGIYSIKVSRDGSALWSGFMTSKCYMPVRCVKK